MEHVGLQAHEPDQSKADKQGGEIDLDHLNISKILKQYVSVWLIFWCHQNTYFSAILPIWYRIRIWEGLVDINHPKTKWKDGKPGHFQMLACERDADDCDGEK